MSSKPNVPPLFSAVARDFAKEFDFAFISTADKDSSKILENLGVKVKKSFWDFLLFFISYYFSGERSSFAVDEEFCDSRSQNRAPSWKD